MGLFRRQSEPAAEERSTINLGRYAGLWADSYSTYSPVPVSTHTALTNAASSACIDTLASSVSSLPLDAVREVGSTRQPVTPTPSLIAQPSGMVERDAWLYQGMQSVLTDGNAFGEITTYGIGGLPTTIEWLDPETVGNRRVRSDGVPVVLVMGAERELYPYGDIFHVPGPFVKPGSPFADSPVERARGTIGAAVAAREFGARFFGDGGHPVGIFKSESELSKEQAEALKRWGTSVMRGNREPLVTGSGITYEPQPVDPEDSQFIDLMQFCVEEACRFWRVPPSMVYGSTSGQSVTYANVSQADLAYLKHSLERHLVRFETSLTRVLPRPQFARFNRNAFLRSDPVTRSEVVDRRLKNKTLAVNEARALEDEQPFPDPEFDEPGIPGGAPAVAPPAVEAAPDA